MRDTGVADVLKNNQNVLSPSLILILKAIAFNFELTLIRLCSDLILIPLI